MTGRYYEDKKIYCYSCRKLTVFHRRDTNNNTGVECHCSECSAIWFEWQNRAVERELEKWVNYNAEKCYLKTFQDFHNQHY